MLKDYVKKIVPNATQREIGLILSQTIHSLIDLSLGVLLLLFRSIAQFVIFELFVQLLHLQGGCFPLLLFFLLLLL